MNGPPHPVPRDQSGRFPKGVSGNPGGRPPGVRTTVYAALAAMPEAIDRLLAIVRSPEASDKDAIGAVATLAKIAGCPWRLPDVAQNLIPDAVLEELDEIARGQVDVHALRRKLLLLIGADHVGEGRSDVLPVPPDLQP